MSKVGALIREQRPAVGRGAEAIGVRVEAIEPATIALDGAGRSQVLEQGGVGNGLPRDEPERRGRRLAARIRPARTLLPTTAKRAETLLRNRRPGIEDDQPAQAVGVPRGERHRVVAAHRMTDQDHALPAERVDHDHEIADEVLGRVGGRCRPLAFAVSALIEGHDVEPIGERSGHPVEPVSVRGPTVQHEES